MIKVDVEVNKVDTNYKIKQAGMILRSLEVVKCVY